MMHMLKTAKMATQHVNLTHTILTFTAIQIVKITVLNQFDLRILKYFMRLI
jgi:hypothetical protein